MLRMTFMVSASCDAPPVGTPCVDAVDHSCRDSSSDSDTTRTHLKISDFRTVKYQDGIYVRVRDAETELPLEVDLTMEGVGKGNELYLGSDFRFDAPSKEMVIYANRKGYFYYHREFTMLPNNGDTLELFLQPIKPGRKMNLHDIHFAPDSDGILMSSYPSLERVKKFLEQNPNTNVRIRGHVNAPDRKNSARVKGLSKKRAKAVVWYLKEKGIDASRLKFEGVGNAEMIYENPTFEEQRIANRRVEILIVK